MMTDTDFAEVKRNCASLTSKQIVIVVTKVFTEVQLAEMEADKALCVIVARENRSGELIYCLCRREDSAYAIECTNKLLRRLGGENITGGMVH